MTEKRILVNEIEATITESAKGVYQMDQLIVKSYDHLGTFYTCKLVYDNRFVVTSNLSDPVTFSRKIRKHFKLIPIFKTVF